VKRKEKLRGLFKKKLLQKWFVFEAALLRRNFLIAIIFVYAFLLAK